MDLRHLRHFIAVAEEGHFGRAAARLGIEQSPLSRSIRHLEGQLRGSLLWRSTRGSELTPLGIALLPEARALLAQAAQFRTLALTTQSARSQRLRIGVGDAVATPRLVNCLIRLRDRSPDIRVEIDWLGAASPITALDAGTVDVSIVLDPSPGSTWARVPCWNEQFIAAVSRRPTPTRQQSLSIGDVLGAPTILVSDAWALAAEGWLRRLADQVNGQVPPVRRVDSCLAFLTAVTFDMGVGILPSGLAEAIGPVGVSTHSVAGRNPRLAVALMYREADQHPGIDALRAVIGQRPWLRSA